MSEPKTGRGKGRPTKYNPDIHIVLGEALGACGYTDKEMAERLKISEATLNNWKNEHPDFLESLKRGKAIPDKLVERSLFQRACGYEHEEDKIFCSDGQIVTAKTIKHYPPDTVACIFFLKNRRPDLWKDKQIIAGEGEGGAILVKIASDFADDNDSK